MDTPKPMATEMVLVNLSGSPKRPQIYESGKRTRWEFDRCEENIIRGSKREQTVLCAYEKLSKNELNSKNNKTLNSLF